MLKPEPNGAQRVNISDNIFNLAPPVNRGILDLLSAHKETKNMDLDQSDTTIRGDGYDDNDNDKRQLRLQ